MIFIAYHALFIVFPHFLSYSIRVPLFIQIIVEPVVKLSIIKRIKLNLYGIMASIQLKIDMYTPIPIIICFSVRHISYTET